MASEQSLWFRIGYALERAKYRSEHPLEKKLAGLAERADDRKARSAEGDAGGRLSTDEFVSAAAVALAGKLLDSWRPRRTVNLWTLLRAGSAGAGAALLVELAGPLLSGRAAEPAVDPLTSDRILGGAGQGLLYAAVVEPRLPGPPLLKGALFGTAEYAAHPAGGLSRLLGARAPAGRLPGVGRLLADLAHDDRGYIEHVTFGIALALLYGSSPSSSGIPPGDEGD